MINLIPAGESMAERIFIYTGVRTGGGMVNH